MLVIQNNKMLGVLNIASEYGGSDMEGERTATAEKDHEEESMSNSQENPGFGMGGCPEDKPDCQAPTGNRTAGGSASGSSATGGSTTGGSTFGNMTGGNTFGNNTGGTTLGNNTGGTTSMGEKSEQSSSFPGGSPTGNFTDEEVSFKILSFSLRILIFLQNS